MISVLAITKENLEKEVHESEKPVLVDVWGPSCQPCLALMPSVEELSAKYGDKVKFVKLNSAENRRLCINMRVIGLPSFLIFKDGKEVARVSGNDVTKESIESLLIENVD